MGLCQSNNLSSACYYGNLKRVKYFVSEVGPCENLKSAFCLAVGKGHLKIVKYLLEFSRSKSHSLCKGSCKGIDLAFPLTVACYDNQLDVLKYFVSLGEPVSVMDIKYAACYGRIDILKYMVSIGVDVTVENNDVINGAFYLKKMEVVEYLKSVGATVTTTEQER